MAETDKPERRKTDFVSRFLLPLLLLGVIAGLIYYFIFMPKDDGSFTLRFKGCDAEGRCAEFTLHAPGYDYRFTFNKTAFDPIEGAEPSLDPVVRKFLGESEGIIGAGLASREGSPGFDNKKLSSCRSMAMAAKLDAAQKASGANLPVYRIALGRYGEASAPTGDTSIERLAVMAFIRSSDDGVNFSQALKNGLKENLPGALAKALRPIARQLDFTRYECWENEFSVTPAAQTRTTCYAEPTTDMAALCGAFQ